MPLNWLLRRPLPGFAEELAGALGFEVVRVGRGKKATLHAEGWNRVHLQLETGVSRGIRVTAIGTTVPPDDLLIISAKSYTDEDPPTFQPLAATPSGDADLDTYFAVVGPPRVVLSWLDHDTRLALRRFSRDDLIIEDGQLRLASPEHPLTAGPMRHTLTALTRLANCFERNNRSDEEALAERVIRDPEAGVRLQALRALVDLAADSDATWEALELAIGDAAPTVRCTALLAVGRPDAAVEEVERLLRERPGEVFSSPSVATVVLDVLAAAGRQRHIPDAERLYVAGPMEVKSVAASALRSIRGRLQPVDGGLSVAPQEDGGCLAVVREQGGLVLARDDSSLDD